MGHSNASTRAMEILRMQPFGESPLSLYYQNKNLLNPPQFAISGETEALGSNNIMGQYLKAMGGYTVEQIGLWTLLQALHRLKSYLK